MDKLTIDNPIEVPKMLSFLTYNWWNAEVQGLSSYPRDRWPDNIPLLYYSYHIMVGLGTIFIAVMLIGLVLLFTKRAMTARWYLWLLLLSFPFPYIANTAGWMTAELGRQPWLVYGLLRTAQGVSHRVAAGTGLFTLLGFLGLYLLLGLLFLFLVIKEINHGPVPKTK
jgi:cytochrome d ubiquinol oxidase subunit I